MSTARLQQAVIISALALLFSSAASPKEHDGAVRLNAASVAYAENLINEGRFVADSKGAWANDRPSAAAENQFIREHNWSEYAKWHLAVDEGHSSEAKAHYKFPYGDFMVLHRCALLAARNRARQYGYEEIAIACNRLLQLLQSKTLKDRRHASAAITPSTANRLQH